MADRTPPRQPIFISVPRAQPAEGPRIAGRSARRLAARRLLSDFELFSRHVMRKPLRPYQLEPAHAILDSIRERKGLTFTVMISRQGGKNELSAQLEAFLLANSKLSGGTIVKGAPTFKPQLTTSMLRLQERLENQLTRSAWSLHLGTIRLGNARILFYSGQPTSHVVGATASILLEIDEAQDFDEEKFLKDFLPMGAATNVTIVLYGTAWTSDTLLEHVRLENRRLEALDGIQRNFFYPWPAVAAHVPSYRTHALTQLARMGAEHPIFRTQYLNETLNAVGRLFSDSQLSQIASPQPYPVVEEASELPTELRRHLSEFPPSSPSPSRRGQGQGWSSFPLPVPPTPDPRPLAPIFIAGIDLAGEDEEAEDSILRSLSPMRDSTAVAIARVVWQNNLGLQEPHLDVVRFYWWTGRKHRELFPQLIDLLKNGWHCQSIAVDATGIGAGIASFLVGALGADIVHPFVFSAVSKSDLGYQLLSTVNAGRLKIPRPPPLPLGEGWGEGVLPPDTQYAAALNEFWNQARLARSNLHANQRLSFYVDPREGHDDLLIAVALAVEAAQHSRPRIATGRLHRP